MINVLLIEKDINYCKNIINTINLNENNDIKIVAIVNDIRELPNIMNHFKIDIFLIDLKLSECSKIINKNFIENKYNKSIILILEKYIETPNFINNNCIYKIILKSDNFNIISKTVNQLAMYKGKNNKNEEDIKNRIINELNYLGYNLLHKGTKYLIETIYLIYTLDNYSDYNLEINIYPIVGAKYKKSWNNIKSSIRYATDIMYYNNSEEKINNY